MKTIWIAALLLMMAFGLAAISGCGNGAPASTTVQPVKGDKKSEHGGAGHSHESAHGGIVNTVGDFHVELVIDQKTAKAIAYITGEDSKSPKYIDAKTILAQIKKEGDSEFNAVELAVAPSSGEKPGARFEATIGNLAHSNALEIFLRMTVDGKQYRTVFQLTPGKLHSASRTYICPMKCEKNKVYPQPGKCPVCKMALVEFKEGQVEHADHTAKHGGTFFMAADNWHHLEGVMASPTEFRLYLYDNFTKPISAKGYVGKAEVVRQDNKGDDLGKSVTLQLQADEKGEFLKASMPAEFTLPLAFTVGVTLHKGERPALFNFTFDKVSKAEDRVTQEKH